MNQHTRGTHAHLAWVFGISPTAEEVGPAMGCMEVDALAAIIAEAGHIDEAAALLHGHAVGDDEGDDVHWGMPRPALRVYARLLAGEASIVDVLSTALACMPSDAQGQARQFFPLTTARIDQIADGAMAPNVLVDVLREAYPGARSWGAAETALEQAG